jgi:hypothetical protein
MSGTDADRLADEVLNAYAEFESRLHGKGPFPGHHFKVFFDAVVHYVEATKDSEMIHRRVAGTVNGLGEILALQTSRAPDSAIADADRLECLLFGGYDPHFEGDEPPGL